jgi:hypothetical protein
MAAVKFISTLIVFGLYGIVCLIGDAYFVHGNAPIWFAVLTRYPLREIIWLVAAALVIGRAIYLSPIVDRATKLPLGNQLSLRLGLALAGIILLRACYGFYVIQKISHP